MLVKKLSDKRGGARKDPSKLLGNLMSNLGLGISTRPELLPGPVCAW